MTVPVIDNRRLRRDAREVERALERIEARIGRAGGARLFGRAVSAGLAAFLDEVRSRTPVRTGQLRRSVGARRERRRGAAFWDLEAGYIRPKPFRKSLAAEYGNARFPDPAGALRTAWQRAAPRLTNDIVAAVQAAVLEEERRLAARLGRRRR